METLKLRTREPVTDDIECWDDDGDLQGIENLHVRNVSSATAATYTSTRGGHRDSLQSRMSNMSDADEDKELQLHLPADDRDSTTFAIANAKSKGIPIPENVPASALLGGTIRRLGGKKVKKAIEDDWGDDLELPQSEGLKLLINDGNEFPESLRQLSGTLAVPPADAAKTPSPTLAQSDLSFLGRLQAAGASQPTGTTSIGSPGKPSELDDAPTIRIPKHRTPVRPPLFDQLPAKPSKPKPLESFDDDLEFPETGELKLSTRKDIPRTPASQISDDFDADWADDSQGSFGTSHGNVRRSGRSNRSSSISARSPSVFSPSLSSCLTAESEDEGLEGLELPDGPLQFQEKLFKPAVDAFPVEDEEKKLEPSPMPTSKDDFFSGIEIGDGVVFDSGKLSLNRNIKHRSQRQSSPKRPAVSLTFTNKPVAPTTRIPKPAGQDRNRSKLEPVFENAGQAHQLRHARSRLDGHSAHGPVAGNQSGSNVSHAPPSTPSRRGIVPRASKETMRTVESTTTATAQMLKSKRSLPILSGRDPSSPSRIQQPPPFHRPSSRTGKAAHPAVPLRPKTPIDRPESTFTTARRQHASAMPTGSMPPPSRPVSTKTSRSFHRPTSSENSNESVASSTRPISRASNQYRQHSPVRRDVAPDSLAKAAASKRQVTKPLRRRAYGDGNELDAFDDLPTSSTAESKYRKAPAIGKLPSSPALRKVYSHQNVLQQSSSRPQSTVPPPSPMKQENRPLPRFAQSTAASVARKQRAGAISPEALRRPHGATEPSSTLTATYRLQPPPKLHQAAPTSRHTVKRMAKPQQKPHLIKQLGVGAHDGKSIKGMQYNPALFRWEGNEHVLAPFNVPASPRTPAPQPSCKPALIANVGSTKGVQVVGGMVFDPHRMCWLKLAPQGQQEAARGRAESGGVASLATEDDDDPFAGFEELEDDSKKARASAAATGPIKDPGSDEEWLVGEEFDVGPEFVRRQRNEEVKWRRRMDGWARVLAAGPRFDEAARWALRDLVRKEHGARTMPS